MFLPINNKRGQAMRRFSKHLLWCSALALAACTNGPQGPQGPSARPAVAQLKEGLNIFRADPAWGIDGAFLQNGRALYFETRVGPLKPEVYRIESPDEPQYEMDARILDQNGSTFSTQM